MEENAVGVLIMLMFNMAWQSVNLCLVKLQYIVLTSVKKNREIGFCPRIAIGLNLAVNRLQLNLRHVMAMPRKSTFDK